MRSRIGHRSHLAYLQIDKPCPDLATVEGPWRWTSLKHTHSGQCSVIASLRDIMGLNDVTRCEQNVLSAGCDWYCIVVTAFCVLAGGWNNGRALVSGWPKDAQDRASDSSWRKHSATPLYSFFSSSNRISGRSSGRTGVVRFHTGFTVELKCGSIHTWTK
jgi:hypothetical protein